MVEELNLTIPQTLVCIGIALVVLVLVVLSMMHTTVDIDVPEVVEDEPQQEVWNANIGAYIQNASEYH